MEIEPTGWIGKILDYAWALVFAAGAAFITAVVKLWRHEERLKALEGHHLDRTRQLSEIDRKIDSNQHILLGTVQKLGDDLRADNRMILSKMLDKVPRA